MSGWTALGTAFFLAASLASTLGPPPAGATHVVNGFLSTTGNKTVDIWTLACNGSTSRCARARLCSPEVTPPDSYVVTILGVAPTSVRGKGEIARSDLGAGGCGEVELCRGSNGPITALVTLSHRAGTTATYNLAVGCFDQSGGALGEGTHTLDVPTNQD